MNSDTQTKATGFEVCIVGVGFVGLTLAMALTRKGIKVRAIEKNRQIVENLNSGITEILEPSRLPAPVARM